MKKLFILVILLLIFQFQVNAQRKLKQLDEDEAKKQEQYESLTKNKGFDLEKFSFGIGGGLQFTDMVTYIMIQPIAGYMVKEKTMLGAGINYSYYGYHYAGFNFSSQNYGPTFFVSQFILKQLYAHAVYEPINFELYDRFSNTKTRQWEHALFLGGGYGEMKGVRLAALYNVLWSANSQLYQSPWAIRIGVMF